MKVVCFYTLDSPYEEEAKLLEASCASFNIPIRKMGYQARGSWVKNAGIKPGFLVRMLDEETEDLLYLDVDARVKQYPKLFDNFDADLGVHYKDGKELLSGTIFLKNNERTKKLVNVWMHAQANSQDVWDQKVLQTLLLDYKDITVKSIPATYCQIFDSMKKAGESVIEHTQASRRYKTQMNASKVFTSYTKIHGEVGGIKIRRSQDGTFFLPRHNAEAIKYLDSVAIRIGALKWKPRLVAENFIEDLKPYFKDQITYIVGKGPSLDHLDASYFAEGPIIALNEAIHKVEPLDIPNQKFGLQQDASLTNSCRPKTSPIFISNKAANFYADYPHAYVFVSKVLGINVNALSVLAAIKIANMLGSNKFKLVCFDACVNHDTSYAKCIGHTSKMGGEPKRFLTHKASIVAATKSPIEWIIPKPQLITSACSTQP
jgi:hypothetical protein